MPAPAAAIAHKDPMDPSDRVEFYTGFDALLEEGEKIASAEVALYPEAAALGFTILEGGEGDEQLDPAIINDQWIRIWVEVEESSRQAPQFDAGAKMPVEFSITTDAVPFRRFQRTLIIPVQHL